ncbi:MAG: DUF2490 domain-containing protein [Lewinellaceae bacterium]|nr:DUF2490 domain-containing protein [Lewinellaceae bacterium]
MTAAQSSYRAGCLPQINLTTDFTNNWRANLRIESRQIFSESTFDHTEKSGGYRYERTDIAGLILRKTDIGTTIGAGYMIRFEGGRIVHRFTQQYSSVGRLGVLRTGRRVTTDQTISPGDLFVFRLRYRVSAEIPLQGQSVDSGEWYTKINNEYLGILEGVALGLEIRAVGVIGLNISDRNKLELGPDYRTNAFSPGAQRHQFWLYMGWFVTI